MSKGTVAALPMPFGIGLIGGGITVTLSAFVGLVGDPERFQSARILETGLGLASIIIGLSVYRMQSKDVRITRAAAMSMFVVGWASFTAVAIAAFVLSLIHI